VGIAERKERERNLRVNTILSSAKRMIGRSGVEGMSMDRLADAVELNKATLYLYFKNKDDIIDAIVYEALVLLEKKFQEVDLGSASGLERVLHLVRATFTFYKEHPVYFHAMNHRERREVHARLETPYATRGDEISARIFETIAQRLRQGIEDGTIRKEIDIPLFLILMFAHVYGIMHTIYAKEDVYKDVLHLDSLTIEESALDIIEHYLRKGEK
jgi:TetR/AcrR family transcriptional regulator